MTAAALLGSGIISNQVSASTSLKASPNTPLQKGLAFYRGQTISFIAPTSAGTPNDLVSRAIALEMGTYLHATINVLDNPSGGFIAGQDGLAAANPNGLTIGFFNLASDYYDLVAHLPGLNFNPLHEVFLAGHPNVVSELIATSTSTYQSFASLLNATSSSPISILATSGAAISTAELLVKTFGIHAQFVPYANTSALVQGFIRGDASVAASPYANFTAQLNSGAYRDLVNFSVKSLPTSEPGYAVLRRAPTVDKLLKKYPPKTAIERKSANYFSVIQGIPGYVLGAPTATKPNQVAALDAAAKFALLTPYVKSATISANNTPGYVSPTAEKLIYKAALQSASGISAAINS